MLSTVQLSPCHGKEIVGGGARGWCYVCGRGYQRDDPRLILLVTASTVTRRRRASLVVWD